MAEIETVIIALVLYGIGIFFLIWGAKRETGKRWREIKSRDVSRFFNVNFNYLVNDISDFFQRILLFFRKHADPETEQEDKQIMKKLADLEKQKGDEN